MSAPFDWLQSYEALNTGAFGDASDPESGAGRVRAGLIANNADYDRLYGTGALNPVDQNAPGLTWQQAIAPTGGVDWSKLPTMGPPGFQLPANSMWRAVGGRSGVTPTLGANTYNDPNYGPLELVQQRAPNEKSMDYLRAATIALVAFPIAATAGAYLAGGGEAALAGTAAGTTGWSGAAAVGKGVAWHALMGELASKVTTAKPAAKAGATTVQSPEQAPPADGYMPENFGASMGSLPAIDDGSQQVATSVAPNAYDNSYNNVVA